MCVNLVMVVISYRTIREYADLHKDVEDQYKGQQLPFNRTHHIRVRTIYIKFIGTHKGI